jgi:lipoprotein-anchoring transpeptidase ErfK/SrfK
MPHCLPHKAADAKIFPMQQSMSRREFLKLGALSSFGLAFSPLSEIKGKTQLGQIGRVAYDSISVFDAPHLQASTLGFKFRDQLLNIFYPLTPLKGPAYNPLWYRIWGGYVHSALLQPVAIQYNQVMASLPEKVHLCRLTIPYSQAFTFSRADGWQPETRFKLYYDSNHWVTDIVDGPDYSPWYQITEAWSDVQYYAKAEHLEAYAPAELTPISAHIPASEKRIEVSLPDQRLRAYEGDEIVMNTQISSGVKGATSNALPTSTPTGRFNISSKLSAKYMGANRLTDTLGDSFLPGVPWTAFFAEGGYAIHGAYWHNNFGAPMSRGCINMRPSEAQWLYRWLTPEAAADDWEARGYGTQVIIS